MRNIGKYKNFKNFLVGLGMFSESFFKTSYQQSCFLHILMCFKQIIAIYFPSDLSRHPGSRSHTPDVQTTNTSASSPSTRRNQHIQQKIHFRREFANSRSRINQLFHLRLLLSGFRLIFSAIYFCYNFWCISAANFSF